MIFLLFRGAFYLKGAQMEKAKIYNFVVRLDANTMDLLENLAKASRRTKAQTVRAAIGVAYSLFADVSSPKDLSSKNHNSIVESDDPIIS
jgi:hypothetical protein